MFGETFDDSIRRLHAEGKSDAEICREIGATQGRVNWRRRQMNLPTIYVGRDIVINEKIREMYNAGMSDARIGEAVGLSKGAVTHRRRFMGLATIRADLDTRKNDLIRKYHSEGKLDTEISAIMGLSKTCIFSRRKRMKLPINKRFTRERAEATDKTDYALIDRLALAWRLFSMDATVEIVAEKVGVDIETAESYRKQMPKIWRGEIERQVGDAEVERYCRERGHRRGKRTSG